MCVYQLYIPVPLYIHMHAQTCPARMATETYPLAYEYNLHTDNQHGAPKYNIGTLKHISSEILQMSNTQTHKPKSETET